MPCRLKYGWIQRIDVAGDNHALFPPKRRRCNAPDVLGVSANTLFFAAQPKAAMPALIKFLHIAAAIVWLGGASFMLVALRPALSVQLAPPQRLPLMAAVLGRFFILVWLSIGILLVTGLGMMLAVGMKNSPIGWHIMLGLGLLMSAMFGHLYFGPYSRFKRAVLAADWPEGGRRAGQISSLALIILLLGIAAIAAVLFVP